MSDVSSIDESLSEALEESLEGLAFEFPEACPDADFDWSAPDLYWTSIDTVVPALGTISIVMPSPLAHSIAEAILGEFDGVEDEDLLDAMGELANIVGGKWLMANNPVGKTIELGLPKVGKGDWASTAGSCTVAIYAIDDEPFGLALQTAEPSA